jgi:hypothetical protein
LSPTFALLLEEAVKRGPVIVSSSSNLNKSSSKRRICLSI